MKQGARRILVRKNITEPCTVDKKPFAPFYKATLKITGTPRAESGHPVAGLLPRHARRQGNEVAQVARHHRAGDVRGHGIRKVELGTTLAMDALSASYPPARSAATSCARCSGGRATMAVQATLDYALPEGEQKFNSYWQKQAALQQGEAVQSPPPRTTDVRSIETPYSTDVS
nr:unnamed protein product [Digitaria exilis]